MEASPIYTPSAYAGMDRQQRIEYAETLNARVSELANEPLRTATDLRKAQFDGLPDAEVRRSGRLLRRRSIRIARWSLKHPKAALALRILSLGILHLVILFGRHLQKKHEPLIKLNTALKALSLHIEDRQARHTELQNILANVPDESGDLLVMVNELLRDQDALQNLLDRVRGRIVDRSAAILDHPATYTNADRRELIGQLYQALDMADPYREFEQCSAIYDQDWNSLHNVDQLVALDQYLEMSNRFAPLIAARAQEVTMRLDYQTMQGLGSEEQVHSCDLYRKLKDAVGVSNDDRVRLDEAFEKLQRSLLKDLQALDWTDREKVRVTNDLCVAADLVEASTACKLAADCETRWTEMSPDEQLKQLQILAQLDQYCEPFLDRRRLEIQESLKSKQPDSDLDWYHCVAMLHELSKTFPEGIEQTFLRLRPAYAERLASKATAKKGERVIVARTAAMLGLDPGVQKLAKGKSVFGRALYFLRTGQSYGKKRSSQLAEASQGLSRDARRKGVAMDIDVLPTREGLQAMKLAADLMGVRPASVPPFDGEVDLLALTDSILPEAIELDLVPTEFRESVSDENTIEHPRVQFLAKLRTYLDGLQRARADGLSIRQSWVRTVLQHFTVKIQEQLAAAGADSEEKRTLYINVVEFVAKGIGFAREHCEDHQWRAARVIFDEYLSDGHIEDQSSETQLKAWVAKRRSELFSQVVQELMQERSRELNQNLDVASVVSTMRYRFRDEFGLGDVPEPRWNMVEGLTEDEVRQRFKQVYTPTWLLDLALEEYRSEGGCKQLKFTAIDAFLRARCRNYEKLCENELILDEEWALTEEGMALYLVENGLIAAG